MMVTVHLFAACATTAPAAESARPNLILILADDLGYETLGANGGTSYRTPRLDRLAADGVRFDACYVQPLCTPTRVQLLTGAYNVRNYTTFGEMDRGLKTFAHRLRDAGYVTGVAGKWQLGREPDSPRTFGFDEAFAWNHTRRGPRYANPSLEINGVERDFDDGQYGPDLVEDFAEDFLARHHDRPFLLYYPMLLTHAPYQPTPDSAAWDPEARGEKVHQSPAHFADMVEHMDKLVGRLIDRLDELQLRERTLVLFVGDNGTGRGTRSRMGERVVVGGKGSTKAAGMHVPLIASWPGRAARGAVCHDLVDSSDFFPTLLAAADVPIPGDAPLDGRSFLPQVLGQPATPREWIYCWYSPHREPPREFAFDHRYKLYRSGEIFDLEHDPQERRPLDATALQQDTTAIARLQAALDQFRDARPAALRTTP